MEKEYGSYSLAPLQKPSNLTPVVSKAKRLQLPVRKQSQIIQLAARALAHPVGQIGMAATAFAAGVALSRWMPGSRQMIPFRKKPVAGEPEEWMITGVGMTIQSGGERVSVWSIVRSAAHR